MCVEKQILFRPVDGHGGIMIRFCIIYSQIKDSPECYLVNNTNEYRDSDGGFHCRYDTEGPLSMGALLYQKITMMDLFVGVGVACLLLS